VEAKARKQHRLVMGMDIGLEEACNLALCALVGRLAYRERLLSKVDGVDEEFMGASLWLYPEVLTLSRGWLGLFSRARRTQLYS
jgi:hypothetical protein